MFVQSALKMSNRCLVVDQRQMVPVVGKLRFDLREVSTLRQGPIQEYGMLLQAVTGVRKVQIRSGTT